MRFVMFKKNKTKHKVNLSVHYHLMIYWNGPNVSRLIVRGRTLMYCSSKATQASVHHVSLQPAIGEKKKKMYMVFSSQH